MYTTVQDGFCFYFNFIDRWMKKGYFVRMLNCLTIAHFTFKRTSRYLDYSSFLFILYIIWISHFETAILNWTALNSSFKTSGQYIFKAFLVFQSISRLVVNTDLFKYLLPVNWDLFIVYWKCILTLLITRVKVQKVIYCHVKILFLQCTLQTLSFSVSSLFLFTLI